MTDTLVVWSEFEKQGFFSNMRENLKDSESKHSDVARIQEIPLKKIRGKLLEEVAELIIAIQQKSIKEIKDECCDVANMCGILFCYASTEELK